ncbi:MAG: hypothetical protein NVS9B4_00070 [Candidatus Acidiferrum sp.]
MQGAFVEIGFMTTLQGRQEGVRIWLAPVRSTGRGNAALPHYLDIVGQEARAFTRYIKEASEAVAIGSIGGAQSQLQSNSSELTERMPNAQATQPRQVRRRGRKPKTAVAAA